MGTALSEQQLKILFRYSKRVILCFDGDTAGQQAAVKSLQTLLPLIQASWQLQFLCLPDGEDPDSYLKQHGVAVFEQQIQASLSLLEFMAKQLLALTQQGGYADLPMQIAKAHEWLQLTLDHGWRAAIQKTLAETLQVNAATLSVKAPTKHLANSAAAPVPLSSSRRSGRFQVQADSSTVALTIVLNHPALVLQLTSAEHNVLAQLSPLLQQMLPLLLRPKVTAAMILSHWQDTPEYNQLVTIVSTPYHLDASQAMVELQHLIKKQQHFARQQQWQQLQQKVKAYGVSALSLEEKQQYLNKSL